MTVREINIVTGKETQREMTAEEKSQYTEEIKDYRQLRKEAYPSIPDQLDMIYHQGISAWKSEIKKIKDKYPKS